MNNKLLKVISTLVKDGDIWNPALKENPIILVRSSDFSFDPLNDTLYPETRILEEIGVVKDLIKRVSFSNKFRIEFDYYVTISGLDEGEFKELQYYINSEDYFHSIKKTKIRI